jgi:hypothetical protein
MESNPYKNYYSNQAGSGIGGFQGVQFQRGAGFFGNVFKNAILPLLKYMGKQAINTGAMVAEDALSGQNVLESMKARGKMSARNIASDAAKRMDKFAQTGTGRKRKNRSNIPVFIQKRKRIGRSKLPKKARRKSKSPKNLNSIFNV